MWLHSQPYAESVCMSMLWINEKPDYSIHILWAGPTPTRARQHRAKLSSFSLWPNKNFLFQAEAHIWIWSFAGSMSSSSSFVLPLKSGPRSTHHFLFPFFQNTQDIDTGMYTIHKLVNTTEIWVGSRPIPQASRWRAVPDFTCAMAPRGYSRWSILRAPPWILHGLRTTQYHWRGVVTSIYLSVQ